MVWGWRRRRVGGKDKIKKSMVIKKMEVKIRMRGRCILMLINKKDNKNNKSRIKNKFILRSIQKWILKLTIY